MARQLVASLVGEFDPDTKQVVAVHTRMIEEPPGDYVAIRNKVLRVEGRARKGDMGSCDGKHSFPCPVWFLHEQEQRAEVDDDTADELEALARTYKEAQAMEARGKKLKEEARGPLMKALESGGYIDPEAETADPPEEINGVKVTPYFHKYKRLDNEALAEDGIDINHYQVEVRSPAVRVTIKE